MLPGDCICSTVMPVHILVSVLSAAHCGPCMLAPWGRCSWQQCCHTPVCSALTCPSVCRDPKELPGPGLSVWVSARNLNSGLHFCKVGMLSHLTESHFLDVPLLSSENFPHLYLSLVHSILEFLLYM